MHTVTLRTIIQCAYCRISVLLEKTGLPIEQTFCQSEICTVLFRLPLGVCKQLRAYTLITIRLIDPYHIDFKAVPPPDARKDSGNQVAVSVQQLFFERYVFLMITSSLRRVVNIKTIAYDLSIILIACADCVGFTRKRSS